MYMCARIEIDTKLTTNLSIYLYYSRQIRVHTQTVTSSQSAPQKCPSRCRRRLRGLRACLGKPGRLRGLPQVAAAGLGASTLTNTMDPYSVHTNMCVHFIMYICVGIRGSVVRRTPQADLGCNWKLLGPLLWKVLIDDPRYGSMSFRLGLCRKHGQ